VGAGVNEGGGESRRGNEGDRESVKSRREGTEGGRVEGKEGDDGGNDGEDDLEKKEHGEFSRLRNQRKQVRPTYLTLRGTRGNHQRVDRLLHRLSADIFPRPLRMESALGQQKFNQLQRRAEEVAVGLGGGKNRLGGHQCGLASCKEDGSGGSVGCMEELEAGGADGGRLGGGDEGGEAQLPPMS